MLRRTGVGRPWASANSRNSSTALATAPGSVPNVIWKPGAIPSSGRSRGDTQLPTGQGPCQGATYPPGVRSEPPPYPPPDPFSNLCPAGLYLELTTSTIDEQDRAFVRGYL